MIISISFIFCTLIFTLMIFIVYFLKKKIKSTETKIYSIILFFSLINILIELLLCAIILMKLELYSFYNLFINKTFLLSLFFWFTSFTIYVLSISYTHSELKKHNKKLLAIILIISLLLVVLPITLVNEKGVAYSTGIAPYFLYSICIVYLIVWIVVIFKNGRTIGFKKYYPFIAFALCFGLLLIIRAVNPGILLNSFSSAFATVLMYFTIENPDIKMLEELYKNRKLIQDIGEDKSKFLFKVTQGIRKPIAEIKKIADISLTENNQHIYKEGMNCIVNKSKEISYLINNLLDVSNLDVSKMKFINSTYNIYNLFEEEKKRINSVLNKDVELRTTISSSIPNSLYGDYIKLKQAIHSILMNAVNYTTKGFIELDVDGLIKYDMCRLVIKISDSGIGMDLQKTNDLLSLDGELTIEDEKKLEGTDIDLKITKKIINTLGGTLMISSEKGKGSEFTITIDQKIIEEPINTQEKKYNNKLSKYKKILLVENNEEIIKKIEKICKENSINIWVDMYGIDCINRIKAHEKFDYIILDDVTTDNSAIDILKQLKKLKEFDIPVIVLVDDLKKDVIKYYINDGFEAGIIKSKINSELIELIDKKAI